MFGFLGCLLFSLIEVLLNFLKYLRRVLFPRIVVLALIGLVLYLCQDFILSNDWVNVLMFFFNNSSVIFSVIWRIMFSISFF